MSSFVQGPIYAYVSTPTGTLTVSASPTPKFSLFKKDGTVVSGFNNVDITNKDTVAAATIRVWYDIDASGVPNDFYDAQFTFGVDGPDSVARVNKPKIPFNLYWNDPVQMILGQLLFQSSSEVVVSDLDKWITMWYYRLMNLYQGDGNTVPAMPTYGAITTWGDKQAVDNALAFLAAASYRPNSPFRAPSGGIASYESGSEKIEWSRPPMLPAKSIEEQWIDAASNELDRVSFIAAARTKFLSQPLFATVGSRRSARESLSLADSAVPLYSLFRDDMMLWNFNRPLT